MGVEKTSYYKNNIKRGTKMDKIEKYQRKINELEKKNKLLIEKVQQYESIMTETEKAKKSYEKCIKECRKLSATYAEAIKEARQVKRDLTEQMEKEIANFRRHSRMLLKDTK